jgi:hypothetical protein
LCVFVNVSIAHFLETLCNSEFTRNDLDPNVWTINNKMIILASLSRNLIDLLKSFYSLNWFPSYTCIYLLLLRLLLLFC